MALLLLAGCAPDNTPKVYNEQVESSFMRACTGNVPPVDGSTTTIASDTFCRCAYRVFADDVPYNDDDKKNRDNGTKFAGYGDKLTFQQLNADLKGDPNKVKSGLPDAVQTRLAACPKSSENTSGSAPASTSGSTVGTTPS